ncbi:hypothetical protein ACHAWO_012902 [Cyclotella atomus]|uniref:PA domain-containing protein n=1 Tax=Cyclotella atomus TaxID=382360 RepID=A0ABD3NIP9_9STRA
MKLLPSLLALAAPAHAILPTAIVEINNIQLLASQASFGIPPLSYENRHSATWTVALPPSDDELLCNDSSNNNRAMQQSGQGVVMLAPRGTCSFQRKALNAQKSGASALIIYGTLSSRYGYNSTMNSMEWPADKYDYDCHLGSASIPSSEYMSKFDFGSGYNPQNDVYLSGRHEENLCLKYADSEDMDGSCVSNKCLLTGQNTTEGSITNYQACCAWDLHVWLFSDSTMKDEELVSIPAVYITMEEADVLLDMVRGAADVGNVVTLSVYERYVPKYNFSAVLIWAFGVFVAWIASYISSGEYRRVWKRIKMQRSLEGANISNDDGGGNVSGNVGRSPGRTSSSVMSSEERGVYRAPVEQQEQTTRIVSRHASSGTSEDPDSVELTAQHALGFIVMASTSLLVLFFFKIYNVVKIVYAFGCSGALVQIVIHPGLWWLFAKLKWEKPLQYVDWLTEEKVNRAAANGGWKGQAMVCLWEFTGPIAPVDLVAVAISYGIGAVWLYVAFSIPHPDTIAFYWIMQDIFGTCMCILFLSTIKLNSIKVAAILLIVAFFYDIFFVFVTPLLTKHGESIMVNVATTGGPPKADPSWCEKYPHDADCKGGDPLPMLFAIPRIGDYQGGCSMLGLGDIVLPGLLLSFASRYDEAKRLIGVIGGGSGRMRSNACPDVPEHKSTNPLCMICCCCRHGYFGPIMVAYAIGLAMANAAVYIMQMGQPALLYLVPCCLGTMVYIGHKSGELNELWEGPRVIRASDRLLYGEPAVESGEEERERSSANENELAISNESESELT